ncbi:MAG TPA: hypothetical protein VNF71_08450 [Acidimicrobiales bacterium]|nr:hypothetical protein [Acidimicrobiales bacterium]
MSLPPFEPITGRLPPGEHIGTWEEVVDRFGWNRRRRQLLDGLAEALALLADAGCTRVWINGSFVTAKEEPGDFDVVWDPTDADLDRLDPIFFDFADGRRAQKERFGGELLPNVVERASGLVFAEFFQNERDTGLKGIVVIDPRRIEQ